MDIHPEIAIKAPAPSADPQPHSPSEPWPNFEALVGRARIGDGEAVQDLWKLLESQKVGGWIKAALVRRGVPRQDLEDAHHEVSVKAVTHLDEIRSVADAQKWLFRVIQTVARKFRVGNHDSTPNRLYAASCAQSVPRPADIDLSRVLPSLPTRWREVLIFHYDKGYSDREVGRLMGCTETAARRIRQKAIDRLRALLIQDDPTVQEGNHRITQANRWSKGTTPRPRQSRKDL